MSNPKISVIMPAYNVEKYIAEAIESILNQTFKDFEFIIIDDGSTDRTWEIIQEYSKKDSRIIAFKNKRNLKICKTLNKGIEIARGKYIARMDADDWSYPDRLEKQYKFMEENPEIVISGGTMEVCNEKMEVLNQRKYNLSDEAIRKKLFRYSPFCHPCTIYKKRVAKKMGGYNEYLFDAEDYDFYFRLGLYGKFGNLPDVIFKLRTRSQSVSQARLRRQEKLTLYIRVKAVMEYGYKMTAVDKLYFLGQYLSIFTIPPKIKFWLFNLMRSKLK